VERILKQTQSEPLPVFVVWEPMLPTDWYRPTRPTLKRVSDPHAVQFWDKKHLIAAQVKQQLQHFHKSDPSCCEDGGHLWDMAAVYPPGVKWGEAAPLFADGPVYRIAPSLEQRVSALRAQSIGDRP
jgi:hypothetical protein